MGNCAGIDWASEKHDVLIEDAAGEELLAATFTHDEDGVSALCAALVRFEVEVVAIERPDGVLVERLLEAGVRVLALHPNQVKASRDRFRASGGKSDRFDRFVLCELARTDRHRFRVLEPDSDQTKALRALDPRPRGSGRREGRAGQSAARGARAVLARPDRSVLAIDSPISLAFLARYPSPGDTRGLGEKRLAAFLKAHRYAKGKTAAELLERLRSAPAGRAGEIETRARRSIVLRLVRTLQDMVEEIHGSKPRSARRWTRTPTGRSSAASSPPDSVICAATLLAEIGDCRGRYPHRDAIAADAGRHPSPTSPANANTRSSAGRATSACATRWARSRTAAAMEPLGRRPLRRRPPPRPQPPPRATHPRPRLEPDHLALLAKPHPIRPRPPHRPATTHHRDHPHQSGPRPDPPATQRMLGAAVTQRAAHRAEREALDDKTTSATPLTP